MKKRNWSLIFLALCLVLAFSVSPVEAQCGPGEFCDRDGDEFIRDHRKCSCPGGQGPDCDDNNPEVPDPIACDDGGAGEPTIEPCPVSLCIADVGKTYRANTPAKQFVDEFGEQGNYTKIESNEFDKILQALTEGEPAQDLCDAYHVTIYNWNSPPE